MMVSLGIYVRRWRRLLRRWMVDPRIHTLLQAIGWVLVGLALPAASLSNQPQPLALGALCALAGWPAVLMAMGSMAGYLLFWGNAGAQGMVWIMGGVLAATILGGRELLRRSPLLMPAIAATIVAGVGLAFQMLLGDETPVLMYVLRIAMAFLAARVFAIAAERRDPVVD